jgi:hypothetical protein
MGEGPRPEAGPVTENATFPAQHVGNFGLEEPSRVIALISVNPFNNVNHSQNDQVIAPPISAAASAILPVPILKSSSAAQRWQGRLPLLALHRLLRDTQQAPTQAENSQSKGLQIR